MLRIRRTWSIQILTILMLYPLAFNASAEREIYRCVYPDGRIEFRGISIVDAECTPVESWQQDGDRPVSGTGAIARESASADSEQPAATESEAQIDPRMRNCEIARGNLEMLESGVPLVITGSDGTPALLSESEHAERLSQTRRDVEYWCGESSGER